MRRIVEDILRFVNSETGQSWSEYGLILALIAVAFILALAALGVAIGKGL